MNELLLGIDIGTSACKVAVFGVDGSVCRYTSRTYPTHYPRQGWAEQDPNLWWASLCSALQDLWEQGIKPADIAAIGVDGQSWSAIPVNAKGKVLTNTPIWMDTRAKDVCELIKERGLENEAFNCSGNPLYATYSLPKVIWYKQHLPSVYREADKILQSNSFIVFRLTGQISQDPSQGYGYHCFDMKNNSWNYHLAKELGINPALLPPIYPSHHLVGGVSSEAASATGLRVGTPVAAGGLDAACAALGVGVIAPGETQEQGGQAGGMSICIDQYRADPRLILGRHVIPELWLLQGGTVGGSGALKWLAQKIFPDSETNYARWDAEAAQIPPGSQGLVFLPYLAGERTPIWNEKAKGVYFGLDYLKSRKHLIRATMEGVAYSLKHNLDTAKSIGVDITQMRAMGGAANSRLWTQIKADITGKTILVPASDWATSLGAALLAGVGAKIYSGFAEAVLPALQIRRVHKPQARTQTVYQRGYHIYLKLYENLLEIMNMGGIQS